MKHAADLSATHVPLAIHYAVAVVLAALFLSVSSLEAFSSRVSKIPNGTVFSCDNCHVTPGGPRNAFGLAVQAITKGQLIDFWGPALSKLDSDGDGYTNGEELGDPDGDGKAVPAITVRNPGVASSTPSPAALQFTSPVLSTNGTHTTLRWSGGLGTGYVVQRKESLTDADWVNLVSTTAKTKALPGGGSSGFYRVEDRFYGSVSGLSVSLSGMAEVPAVETAGTGFGVLSVETNTLTYRIVYSGLSSDATAAHLNGPADVGTTADPLLSLDGVAGCSGVLYGKVTITDLIRTNLLAGRAYVNIHTAQQPGGEIRGQAQAVP